MEALILQRERQHADLSALFDVLIHQSERNSPERVLEAVLETQDRINSELDRLIENMRPGKVQKSEFVAPKYAP